MAIIDAFASLPSSARPACGSATTETGSSGALGSLVLRVALGAAIIAVCLGQFDQHPAAVWGAAVVLALGAIGRHLLKALDERGAL